VRLQFTQKPGTPWSAGANGVSFTILAGVPGKATA
jgi:hypothetical protein